MARRPARAGVVLLCLDVAERRNAMTAELTEAWTAAMDGVAADRTVRCVVVTCEGAVLPVVTCRGWRNPAR